METDVGMQMRILMMTMMDSLTGRTLVLLMIASGKGIVRTQKINQKMRIVDYY